MSDDITTEFVFANAAIIPLSELPQTLHTLARKDDKDRSTRLLIEVNYEALQQFQQSTNVGFLWSFELLIQSLNDMRHGGEALTLDHIRDLHAFLDGVQILANNMLEARAYALSVLEGRNS